MAKKTTPAPTPAPVLEPEVPVIDVDTAADRPTADQLGALEGGKPVNKPDVSRLPDAVVAGIPQFKTGDKLVVERYATVLPGRPYLDTKTYKVIEVNPSSGFVRLYDEAIHQFASTNFLDGLRAGYVYKLAMGNAVTTKRKRGRPRKNPVVETPKVASTEPKRGRGRPKGSKNRDKAVIVAEKAEKRAVRAAKLEAKKKPSKKGK